MKTRHKFRFVHKKLGVPSADINLVAGGIRHSVHVIDEQANFRKIFPISSGLLPESPPDEGCGGIHGL